MPENELKDILEPIRFGEHLVPGIWRYMMPEDVFYFRVDPEARSSCFHCPKVKESGFHPDVRCCTVIPRVPNFLLGLCFLSGSQALDDVLAKGMLLPEGMIISPYDLRRSLSFISAPNKGRPDIFCPLLDLESKRCQIYAFRNTTCSTFFCKHDRGLESKQFWSDLCDLGTQIEAALSQWSLIEAGFDLSGYFKTLNELDEDFPEFWSEDARRKLFGSWFGRERELFEATARVILKNKSRLFEIASAFKPLQALEYDRKLQDKLAGSLPDRLIDEALPVGEPESISSLWYQTQLAARNLQLAAKT